MAGTEITQAPMPRTADGGPYANSRYLDLLPETLRPWPWGLLADAMLRADDARRRAQRVRESGGTKDEIDDAIRDEHHATADYGHIMRDLAGIVSRGAEECGIVDRLERIEQRQDKIAKAVKAILQRLERIEQSQRRGVHI